MIATRSFTSKGSSAPILTPFPVPSMSRFTMDKTIFLLWLMSSTVAATLLCTQFLWRPISVSKSPTICPCIVPQHPCPYLFLSAVPFAAPYPSRVPCIPPPFKGNITISILSNKHLVCPPTSIYHGPLNSASPFRTTISAQISKHHVSNFNG